MERYPDIADHGLIGDLQTAALVSTDGTIDWFCAPRFDSPSIFASLLDADKGGYFRIGPVETGLRDEADVRAGHGDPRHAVPDRRTASPRSSTSCRSPTRARRSDRHRLVRLVRVVRGDDEDRRWRSSRGSTTGASRTRSSAPRTARSSAPTASVADDPPRRGTRAVAAARRGRRSSASGDGDSA